MSRSIQIQAMQSGIPLTDGRASLQEVTVVAPAGNSQITAPDSTLDPAIIQPSNWFGCLLQIGRVSGSIGAQVYDLHGTIAPGPGKSDAASDGGVILLVICGGRIQPDEQYTSQIVCPAPMQAIAILSTGGKPGSGAKVVHFRNPAK
jgi:hypothetical protein